MKLSLLSEFNVAIILSFQMVEIFLKML